MSHEEQESAERRFARNARRRRQELGMSQDRLATLLAERGCPISQTAITKLEREDDEGRRPIRLDEAQAIADVLAVPLEKLLLSGEAAADYLIEEFYKAARVIADDIQALRNRRDQLFDQALEGSGRMPPPERRS